VVNEIRFLYLIRKLAGRIHELACDAVIFDDAELPKLTLDACRAMELENIGKF
jgi:hypothetical protein